LTGPKCICPDSFHVSLARRNTDYSVEGGTERPQRSLMIYLIEARHADGRLDLHVLDWWNLLGLAAKYGWRPAEGVDHYLYDASFIPGGVSRDIARALKKALPHLPEEEGPRLRKANPQLRGIAGPVPRGPYKDPSNHFGGKRKWLVGEFIELCQKGILDIRKTT
jgi:hypothetical protein